MACALCCPSFFPHAVRVQGLPGWKSPGSVGAGLQRVACALCCLCFAWWLCGVSPVWWPGPLSLVPCSSVGSLVLVRGGLPGQVST